MYISEIFYSIQGEGPDQGLPTKFVRCQGCDVNCVSCDTKYSWHQRGGVVLDVGDIMGRVADLNRHCRRLCITGGEPLLQFEELDALVHLAANVYGYIVTVETSGTKQIHTNWPCNWIVDIKTPSTGVQDKMRWKNFSNLGKFDAVVAVIRDRADYDFAINVVERYIPGSVPVYLNPDGSVMMQSALMQDMARWIKEDLHPQVRLEVQLHRLIWGNERAV